MDYNNRNNNHRYRQRPSIRTDQFHVKNVVTPDTQAEKRLRERRARQTREAHVLSKSLGHKRERDFNIKGSVSGNISSTAKRLFVIAIIVIVVIAIGVCAGIFAFMASTSSKLSIDDAAKNELVKAQENREFFTLFSLDISETPDNIADVLFITRIDPSSKHFILINVPVSTYVASSAGGGTTLQKISEGGNDAELISSVATFSELSIAHYVKANAEGLKNFIDIMGGIEVDLLEYVDDPTVSDVYIPQGKSKINSEQALTLLRSKNFSGGEEVISMNQRELGMGLLKAALFSDNVNVAMLVDKLAGLFKTDMSTSDCINFVDTYKTTEESKIQSTEIPGYKTMRNNSMVYMIDASTWKNMKIQLSYGMLPVTDDEKTINDVDPSSFTIFIQNGAGIDGAGSMLADKLTSQGYNVTGKGNAESNIYQETLIIYKDESMKGNAQAVKNSINNGRLVNGNGLYNMTTDVLIIIGADLKI